MRFVLLAICVIILCSTVLAFPAKGGSNNACSKPCDDYEPVCASPKSGKGAPLSFGSQCVLERYNCEHPTATYAYKSGGECPGSTGIRLQ